MNDLTRKIIPNLRTRTSTRRGAAGRHGRVLALKPDYTKSLAGIVPRRPRQVMETAYRMQFECFVLSFFSISGRSRRTPDDTARRLLARVVFWPAACRKAGVRSSTSKYLADRKSGTITRRDVNETCASAVPTWTRQRLRSFRDLKARRGRSTNARGGGGDSTHLPCSESGSDAITTRTDTHVRPPAAVQGGIAYGATAIRVQAERIAYLSMSFPRHGFFLSARHGIHEADVSLRRPRFPSH